MPETVVVEPRGKGAGAEVTVSRVASLVLKQSAGVRIVGWVGVLGEILGRVVSATVVFFSLFPLGRLQVGRDRAP